MGGRYPKTRAQRRRRTSGFAATLRRLAQDYCACWNARVDENRGVSHETSNRILLIDDDEDARVIFKVHLRRAGVTWEIDTADGGEAALEYFGSCIADKSPWPILVFLDIRMPRMTGLEVLGWLRSQNLLGRFVVVMMTTSRSADDISNAFKGGAHAFITKTGKDEVLQALVRDAARLLPSGTLASGVSRYWPTPRDDGSGAANEGAI